MPFCSVGQLQIAELGFLCSPFSFPTLFWETEEDMGSGHTA